MSHDQLLASLQCLLIACKFTSFMGSRMGNSSCPPAPVASHGPYKLNGTLSILFHTCLVSHVTGRACVPTTSTGSACSGRPLAQASCSGSGNAALGGRHPPDATLRGRSLTAATSTGQCLHAQ